MKNGPKILFALAVCLCLAIGLSYSLRAYADAAAAQREDSERFERAVEIIKRYETIHQPRHWPFVGYGHRVLRGEKFSRRKALDEQTADALLRKDLLKNCAVFRQYGADSLLLGALAYNVGMGTVSRSSIVRMLEKGDRNIRDIYIAHCRYRGKVHASIRQRRIDEFEALFVETPREEAPLMTQSDSLLQAAPQV